MPPTRTPVLVPLNSCRSSVRMSLIAYLVLVVISSDDSGSIHMVDRELDTAPVFQGHLNLVSCTDLRSEWS